jgi:hypothetical protein
VSRPNVNQPNKPEKAGRQMAVPEANFRGPGSEAKVRNVTPEQAKSAPTQLQTWVRQQNKPQTRVPNRATVDTVGNLIPNFYKPLERGKNITIHYTKIVNHIGSPRYPYMVAPGAAWGHHGYFHKKHSQPSVVINFFYPFYYSDPGFVGFAYDGYYPSVYTYFGWAPGWVYPERTYYAPDDYIYYPDTPYRYYRSYELDTRGATRAIRDIRNSWLEGDTEALAAHLTNQLDIRIYFDGEYAYTTSVDDFYAMTLDTLSTTWTVDMEFDDPIWISSHEVFYTGYQVFADPYGEEHTVYVSYRFRKLGTEWYLVALGTSLNPIEHKYQDFRYTSR